MPAPIAVDTDSADLARVQHAEGFGVRVFYCPNMRAPEYALVEIFNAADGIALDCITCADPADALDVYRHTSLHSDYLADYLAPAKVEQVD